MEIGVMSAGGTRIYRRLKTRRRWFHQFSTGIPHRLLVATLPLLGVSLGDPRADTSRNLAVRSIN